MRRSRNKFIAFFCVVLFVAGGTMYYRHWVIQQSFSVILILADGLTTETLGRHRAGGGGRIRLDDFPCSVMLSQPEAGGGGLGSAALGSLLATGEMVGEGWIGLRPDGRAIETAFDLAHRRGRTTGLVSNGAVTSRLLAPFYANARPGADAHALLAQAVDLGRVDILMGEAGGSVVTAPGGRSLLGEFAAKGYDTPATMIEVLDRPEWKFPRVAALFEPGRIEPSDRPNPETPTLPKLVRAAIRFLQYNPGGYFLVVHVTPGPGGEPDLVALDETIRAAIDFSGDKALLVVAGTPDPRSPGPCDLLAFARGRDAGCWNGVRPLRDLHHFITSKL